MTYRCNSFLGGSIATLRSDDLVQRMCGLTARVQKANTFYLRTPMRHVADPVNDVLTICIKRDQNP